MNNRREFLQHSLLSFGILPLFNKFGIGNNDLLPRWDVASKVCENFILQMDRVVKSQTKIIDSIDIHWNNIVYDNNKVGIYGYCCSDHRVIAGTSIDWLKRYNVSTDLIIDCLCNHYMKNGYTRSKPVIGSKGGQWGGGVRLYKENNQWENRSNNL